MATNDAGVSVRGLYRRFGNRWVLSGVDLDVVRGQGLMLTGANGSGKTTLLRCLATALRPHHGTVQIFGEDPFASRFSARERIALFSHATRLYEDLSARDNLAVWASFFGDGKRRTQVHNDALLVRVGLDPTREEPVRSYSAGMRRRTALALVLLKQPTLLLLDEPFAALDPDGRAMVSSVIDELTAQGVTRILATHLPQIAGRHCDVAMHLHDGKVSWMGSPSEAPAIDPADAEAVV